MPQDACPGVLNSVQAPAASMLPIQISVLERGRSRGHCHSLPTIQPTSSLSGQKDWHQIRKPTLELVTEIRKFTRSCPLPPRPIVIYRRSRPQVTYVNEPRNFMVPSSTQTKEMKITPKPAMSLLEVLGFPSTSPAPDLRSAENDSQITIKFSTSPLAVIG